MVELYVVEDDVSKEEGLEVVMCATDKDRQISPTPDILYDLGRTALEGIDSPWLLGHRDVTKKVMRDATLLSGSDLVGENGQAIVQLHGIGIDNLAPKPSRQLNG